MCDIHAMVRNRIHQIQRRFSEGEKAHTRRFSLCVIGRPCLKASHAKLGQVTAAAIHCAFFRAPLLLLIPQHTPHYGNSMIPIPTNSPSSPGQNPSKTLKCFSLPQCKLPLAATSWATERQKEEKFAPPLLSAHAFLIKSCSQNLQSRSTSMWIRAPVPMPAPQCSRPSNLQLQTNPCHLLLPACRFSSLEAPQPGAVAPSVAPFSLP